MTTNLIHNHVYQTAKLALPCCALLQSITWYHEKPYEHASLAPCPQVCQNLSRPCMYVVRSSIPPSKTGERMAAGEGLQQSSSHIFQGAGRTRQPLVTFEVRQKNLQVCNAGKCRSLTRKAPSHAIGTLEGCTSCLLCIIPSSRAHLLHVEGRQVQGHPPRLQAVAREHPAAG